MNTQAYIDCIPIYIKRLEEDGFSKDTVDVGKWITEHFRKYCLKNNIADIDMNVISSFYLEQYDIDIYNLACIRQATLRKPLLTLFELYETNTYYKNHSMKTEYILNEYYSVNGLKSAHGTWIKKAGTHILSSCLLLYF